jgi:hypothetical protein
MTFKERIAAATQVLGATKAAEVLARLERNNGGCTPILKDQVRALEDAQKVVATPPAIQNRVVSQSGRSTAKPAIDLFKQYHALNSEQDRRSFWAKHRTSLEDPRANTPELARICMLAGKQFSAHAKCALGWESGPWLDSPTRQPKHRLVKTAGVWKSVKTN